MRSSDRSPLSFICLTAVLTFESETLRGFHCGFRQPSARVTQPREKSPTVMYFFWLGFLWLATILSVTSSQDTDKRAPRPNAFAAMRGKKDFDYDSGFYYDKRVPMGFAGVRGKKLSDDFSSYYEAKRAPSRSFFAVKGKRELLNPDLLDDMQISGMDKRAPARFFGMRGKKGPSSQSFFGMRGKKDYGDLSDARSYWNARAGYADDLTQLLESLNAGDRAKRDVADIRSANSEDSSLTPHHSSNY